jgi:hypothetical protein
MTTSWRAFGSSQRQGVEDPLERNKKDQALRQQQQAEQQRKQQEELKKKQQQEQAVPTRNPLQPIQQALSTDLAPTILQGIDNTFGTNLNQIREQNIQNAGGAEAVKAQQQARPVGQDEGVNVVGSEILRGAIKAPVNLLEGVLNTGELVKDTIVAPFQKDPTKNPFDKRYIQAAYDFKVQGAKTPVGKLAEGLLTFGLAMRQAAIRLPKAATTLGTGGKGIQGAVASGIVPGIVADLLLAKPNDGNLANLVQDIVPPEYRDSFFFALAIDKEDNPWQARIKTVLEGAGTGAAVDTLLFVLKGRRAAQRALKEGKSKDAALKVGIEEANAEKTVLDKQHQKNVNAEAQRWTVSQQIESERLAQRQEQLTQEEIELRRAGITEEDPNLQQVQKNLEDNRIAQAQLDSEAIRGYDPDSPELLPHERSASISTTPDVNRIAKQQLELETGAPISSKLGGATSAYRENITAHGGSEHMITDAGYRILNLEDGVEKLVKDTSKRTDLQTLAKSMGRSVDSIVRDAARIVQDVRDATASWTQPEDNLLDVLKKSGAVMEVRGATDGTSGDIVNREGVVALKTLITDTSNQIYELAMNADKMLEARLAGGNQFDRLVDRLVTLLGLHKQAAVFHGGGLQAFSIDPLNAVNSRGPDVTQATDEAALTIGQAKAWASKIKELARQGDPDAQEQMQQLVRAMALAGGDPTKAISFVNVAAKLGTEGLMQTMYNSLLSGPITHLRNIIGNSYALIERPTSILLRGVLNGDEALRRSAIAGYHGMFSSVREAWKVAGISLRTGDSVNLNAKFVLQDAVSLAQVEQLKMAAKPGSGEELAAGFVEALLRFTHNPILSLPNRLLIGEDDFFKTLVARARVQTEAMYKAVSDAKNDNDVETLFQSYMTEFSRKIDPVTGRILDPTLLEYVDRATFQNNPGGMVNSFANFINNTPLGIGRIFTPFIRTPANILAYAGQHTPGLARHLTQYKEAIRSGDELLIAEYKGRAAIGTMTVSMVGLAALNGYVTGNGPSDPKERAIWSRTHKPMSVKVGDKWVSYQSIEPLSTIISIAADIAMLARMGSANAAERIAGQLGFAIAAAVTQKSYLAGLSDIAEIIDPTNLTPEGFSRGLLNTANNFIPGAGIRRMFANAIDPYLKEVDNELQRALNVAIPGYKLYGPTKVDFLTGEEMSSSGGGWYNAISPIRIAPVNADPVKDMLVDINYEMKDVIKYGQDNVELTAEMRRNLALEMHNSGVYQKLNNLRQQEWFKQDVKEWKDRGLSFSAEGNRPRHYQAVERIINNSRQAAFRKMGQTDPGYATLVREARLKKVQSRRGVYTTIDNLTNYPN